MPKIETSEITKIRISEIPNLDPISVFFEDHRKGCGTITITCFGTSWSHCWGATGERKIKEFFMGCDKYYLGGKFDIGKCNEFETDHDKIPAHLKGEVIELRKEGSLTKEEAREMFDPILKYEKYSDDYSDQFPEYLYDALHDLDDWYCRLPTKTTSAREYLWRIIEAIKEALK